LLFGGLLQSTVRCTACNSRTYSFEYFLDLSLPLPKQEETLDLTVSSLLAHQRPDSTIPVDVEKTSVNISTLHTTKCTILLSQQILQELAQDLTNQLSFSSL
jgi:hypothetical protein